MVNFMDDGGAHAAVAVAAAAAAAAVETHGRASLQSPPQSPHNPSHNPPHNPSHNPPAKNINNSNGKMMKNIFYIVTVPNKKTATICGGFFIRIIQKQFRYYANITTAIMLQMPSRMPSKAIFPCMGMMRVRSFSKLSGAFFPLEKNRVYIRL